MIYRNDIYEFPDENAKEMNDAEGFEYQMVKHPLDILFPLSSRKSLLHHPGKNCIILFNTYISIIRSDCARKNILHHFFLEIRKHLLDVKEREQIRILLSIIENDDGCGTMTCVFSACFSVLLGL